MMKNKRSVTLQSNILGKMLRSDVTNKNEKEMKMNKKTSEKRGQNQVENLPKGLEVGRHIGSRFWEGLLGGIPAKISHRKTIIPADDKQNFLGNNGGKIGGNQIKQYEKVSGDNYGNPSSRTRRWEGMFKPLLVLIPILILLVSFIVLVSALTSDEKSNLQSELSQLESNLTDSGYSWLVDYNLTYPSVEVYRENSQDEIATFNSITGGQKGEGVWVNVNGGVWVPYEIMQMKIKLDAVRKELK